MHLILKIHENFLNTITYRLPDIEVKLDRC